MDATEILKLYRKEKFSNKEIEIIINAIDNFQIDTEEIKDDFLGYISDQDHDFTDEEVWSYTDENFENLKTHAENYKSLVNFLEP